MEMSLPVITSSNEKKIGISLGWNCQPAMQAVKSGDRSTRANGYKTCPFDLMMSNYCGLIECIHDDFVDFCNTDYLEVKSVPKGLPYVDYNDYCTEIIINTKYKFLFNHESPGHPFLAEREKWPNGKTHFTDNNFEVFINRYNRRIENFRNYIQTDNASIIFIISRFNCNRSDLTELDDILKEKYPHLKYDIKIINGGVKPYYNALRLMGYDKNDPEIKRCIKT